MRKQIIFITIMKNFIAKNVISIPKQFLKKLLPKILQPIFKNRIIKRILKLYCLVLVNNLYLPLTKLNLPIQKITQILKNFWIIEYYSFLKRANTNLLLKLRHTSFHGKSWSLKEISKIPYTYPLREFPNSKKLIDEYKRDNILLKKFEGQFKAPYEKMPNAHKLIIPDHIENQYQKIMGSNPVVLAFAKCCMKRVPGYKDLPEYSPELEKMGFQTKIEVYWPWKWPFYYIIYPHWYFYLYRNIRYLAFCETYTPQTAFWIAFKLFYFHYRNCITQFEPTLRQFNNGVPRYEKFIINYSPKTLLEFKKVQENFPKSIPSLLQLPTADDVSYKYQRDSSAFYKKGDHGSVYLGVVFTPDDQGLQIEVRDNTGYVMEPGYSQDYIINLLNLFYEFPSYTIDRLKKLPFFLYLTSKKSFFYSIKQINNLFPFYKSLKEIGKVYFTHYFGLNFTEMDLYDKWNKKREINYFNLIINYIFMKYIFSLKILLNIDYLLKYYYIFIEKKISNSMLQIQKVKENIFSFGVNCFISYFFQPIFTSDYWQKSMKKNKKERENFKIFYSLKKSKFTKISMLISLGEFILTLIDLKTIIDNVYSKNIFQKFIKENLKKVSKSLPFSLIMLIIFTIFKTELIENKNFKFSSNKEDLIEKNRQIKKKKKSLFFMNLQRFELNFLWNKNNKTLKKEDDELDKPLRPKSFFEVLNMLINIYLIPILFLPITQAELREKELIRLYKSISKRIFKGIKKQLIHKFLRNSTFLCFFSLELTVKNNLKFWLNQKRLSVETNLRKFKLILELFKLIEILDTKKDLTFFETIKIFQLYKKVLFKLIFETNLTKEDIEEILDLPLY